MENENEKEMHSEPGVTEDTEQPVGDESGCCFLASPCNYYVVPCEEEMEYVCCC